MAGQYTWCVDPAFGVPLAAHNETIRNMFAVGLGFILRQIPTSPTPIATDIYVSALMSGYVTALPEFQAAEAAAINTTDTHIGYLNGSRVVYDTSMAPERGFMVYHNVHVLLALCRATP